MPKALFTISASTPGTSLAWVMITYTVMPRYSAAITGTIHSATWPTLRMPPKMIGAVSSTRPMATRFLSQPSAPSVAATMELACTALNTRPKATISEIENAMPSQRMFRPFWM
ncbi:hypothetical protein D3C78_1228580 [compost metagenome]